MIEKKSCVSLVLKSSHVIFFIFSKIIVNFCVPLNLFGPITYDLYITFRNEERPPLPMDMLLMQTQDRAKEIAPLDESLGSKVQAAFFPGVSRLSRGTPLCRYYAGPGTCRQGDRCPFHHSEDPLTAVLPPKGGVQQEAPHSNLLEVPHFWALQGFCKYIPIPADLLEPSQDFESMMMMGGPSRMVGGWFRAGLERYTSRLFIGHTTYHTTTKVLRWLVYQLTGLEVGYAESLRSANTARTARFYLHFPSVYDAEETMHVLHKRVLFDEHGVWYAETPEQYLALEHFILNVRPTFRPAVSLPMDSMVVENAPLYYPDNAAPRKEMTTRPVRYDFLPDDGHGPKGEGSSSTNLWSCGFVAGYPVGAM